MKHILSLSLLIPVLTTSAFAQEEGDPKPAWRLYVGAGLVTATNTDVTFLNFAGSRLASVSESGKSSVQFGVEAHYTPDPAKSFSAGLAVERNAYKYKDGTGDTELAFLIIPRLSKPTGAGVLWAGLGVGMVITSIGEPTAQVDGLTFTTDNSASTLALSPRIGIDLPIGQDTTLGFQAAYFTTSGDVPGNVSDGSSTSPFTMDMTRSWVAVGARIGFAF